MKYIVDEKDLYDLINASWELDNLYKYGVDNWEGYGEIDEDDKFSPKDVTDYIKENFESFESIGGYIKKKYLESEGDEE